MLEGVTGCGPFRYRAVRSLDQPSAVIASTPMVQFSDKPAIGIKAEIGGRLPYLLGISHIGIELAGCSFWK
jgi:hypothetical protein